MPLTELVNFKTRLQRGNRIQLPKLVRWKYKLEQDQVLKVALTAFVFLVVGNFLRRDGLEWAVNCD